MPHLESLRHRRAETQTVVVRAPATQDDQIGVPTLRDQRHRRVNADLVADLFRPDVLFAVLRDHAPYQPRVAAA